MYETAAMIGGAALVPLVWSSVLRTVLVPRCRSSRMARWAMRVSTAVGGVVARGLPHRASTRVWEFCVPVGLFVTGAGWLAGLALGFWLVSTGSAGVSVLVTDVFGVSALLVLAAFAAYLVHFMHAYRRRELMVSRLAASVSRISDAETLLAEYLRSGSRESLDSYFAEWAGWFADIGDTHTGYPGLVYHRGVGRRSWPMMAVVVMDAAAVVEACAPRWAPLHTRVLLAAGSSCLQRLAEQVDVRLPVPTVSLQGREERAFGDTFKLTTDAGLEAERDLDHAWVTFQKIRVQYAPYAMVIECRLHRPWRQDEED